VRETCQRRERSANDGRPKISGRLEDSQEGTGGKGRHGLSVQVPEAEALVEQKVRSRHRIKGLKRACFDGSAVRKSQAEPVSNIRIGSSFSEKEVLVEKGRLVERWKE
jgi:hypothetical protein